MAAIRGLLNNLSADSSQPIAGEYIVYAYYDDLVHANRVQLLLGVLTPHRAGDAQLPTSLWISYESSAFVLCHSSQVLARNVYKRSATATLKMLQVVTEKFMLQVLQKIYAYVCSI